MIVNTNFRKTKACSAETIDESCQKEQRAKIHFISELRIFC